MGIEYLSFLMDLESRMRVIQEDEYSRFMASENQWWEPFVKVQPSMSRRELFFWVLSTARIESQNLGGNIEFEDMAIIESDYTVLDAGKGIRIRKNKFEDLYNNSLGGEGIMLAEAWTRQISAQAAYWPQRQVADLIKNGETGLGYDKVAYFSSAHPYNPLDASSATFQNVFTGGASGSYPGALKIDESITLDVAFQNLAKAITYIKAIKMPNGKDPRFLVPKYLLVPPALQTRAMLLTDAKFFALQSGGGAGTADVAGAIKRWGLNTPVVAPELGADFGGSDTSWYIGCEEITSSQLGALLYIDREPFKITYYTGDGGGTGVDAILDRARELEWHVHGRNVAGYGHPYALFKAKAA